MKKPAVLGGSPAFRDAVPIVRPTIPDPSALARKLEAVLSSGMLTNGPAVRQLEEQVAELVGVAHVVAVANCTAGLMLVYQALGLGRDQRVVLPSFTFSASAHAVIWAGGDVDFADVDARTGTLDPADLVGRLDGAAAISATHTFGTPCDVERLESMAKEADVPVVFDAAHALGSRRRGAPIGRFGAAEVFSLSPTKVVVAGEGGVVTTSDGALAEQLRLGRDYGNPGDYNCRFPGLNARMSELHATVAVASLEGLDERIDRRAELVGRFDQAVSGLPGLRRLTADEGDRSTHKDLTIAIDENEFGIDAATVQTALKAEHIDSRRYYWPPIDRQAAYAERWRGRRPLPVTDSLAPSVLSPPLWSHMDDSMIDGIAAAVVRLHEHAPAVRAALGA